MKYDVANFTEQFDIPQCIEGIQMLSRFGREEDFSKIYNKIKANALELGYNNYYKRDEFFSYFSTLHPKTALILNSYCTSFLNYFYEFACSIKHNYVDRTMKIDFPDLPTSEIKSNNNEKVFIYY